MESRSCADRKTPKGWHYKNFHFLSMDLQDRLGFRLAAVSRENSYTRKNIGYLYAIRNGARWIYDTDDDNKPYGRSCSTRIASLAIQACGQEVFPQSTSRTTRLGKIDYVYVVPCVHLHYNKDSYTNQMWMRFIGTRIRVNGLDERFNEFAPSVVLDLGTYSPWNSQNTLFYANAFFTLFLPVTVAFRVTDIWRSYFAQKLLHLIGERIAFYPANAIQFRNAHNYMADFQQELDVYTKSGKFVDFLETWHCDSNDISNCTVELAEQLG